MPINLTIGRGPKWFEDNAWKDDALIDPFHFLAFNGTIDDVRIWNRSLSAEQVNVLFNNRTDLIVSQETQSGEVWSAQVTPNDGSVNTDGPTVQSNNLTIQAAVPTPTVSAPGGGGRGGGGGGGAGELAAECSDFRDNDFDGLVDLSDPDCTSATDNSEASASFPAVLSELPSMLTELLEELLEEIEELPEIEEPAPPKLPKRPIIAEEIIIPEEKAPINVVLWVVLFIILFAALIAYYAKQKSVYEIPVRKYSEGLGRIQKKSRDIQKKQPPAKLTIDVTSILRSIKSKLKPPSTISRVKDLVKDLQEKSKDLEIKIQKKEPIEKPKEEQEALTKVADVVTKLQEKNDLLSIKIKKKQTKAKTNKAIDRVAHLVSDLEKKNQLLSVKIQVKKDEHVAELKETAEQVTKEQTTKQIPCPGGTYKSPNNVSAANLYLIVVISNLELLENKLPRICNWESSMFSSLTSVPEPVNN